MKIKQIYHNHELWEDWKAGLFNSKFPENHEYLINESKRLLSDCEKFLSVARKMVNEWHYAAEVNLSNSSCNRQAWVGQASCCFNHGACERITIVAWRLLSEQQQNEANAVADKVIREWEERYLEELPSAKITAWC